MSEHRMDNNIIGNKFNVLIITKAERMLGVIRRLTNAHTYWTVL